MSQLIEKSFTANSQTSDELRAKREGNIAINVDFTTGSGSMTVALQRRIGSGAFLTIESYTSDTTKNIEAVSEHCTYRCTTTAFTSGTVAVGMAAPF